MEYFKINDRILVYVNANSTLKEIVTKIDDNGMICAGFCAVTGADLWWHPKQCEVIERMAEVV